MSDAATETTAQAEPAAPVQTLPELLQSTLANATAPMTLKELAKVLPRPKKVKADEFEASLPGYLAEDLQAGRVFKFGSGKAGLERYWNRDEKHAIQEAVRTAAAEPKKLGELKKVAIGLTKADKPFAEGIVDEMVASKHLHEHPGKGPLYGRDAAIDPNDKEKVSAAILAAAATPTKLADLIKVALKETKADKEFVTATANDLVTAEQLHKQGPAKTAPYGAVKPPRIPPLETPSGKKEFDKLAKAAHKLIQTVSGVTVDDLLKHLRISLAAEAAKPVPTPENKPTPHAEALAEKHVAKHHDDHAKPALTPERIRTTLKTAYDDLCLDPDFEDKLVEIRRLYHDAARILPGLTVPQFHAELKHLQSERAVQLQPINEVQRAKEPELAIHQNDRVLYYVIWK